MDRIDTLNAAFEGKYQIERELGSGGMASVYLAEDVKHHRKVAIKVLRDDLSASVGAERFLREIEIAAHLQHPNILPLLDSGEASGRLFYVMPFVEGQSLRSRLTREHELPIGDALRLLVEIVDALAYAHEHGVVHRDIKPDNIMLSGRHALIADFGVARALSEATGSHKITSLGVALGTPSYMSPEQATADPMVDHRTDIYSVGVMAYELIAGETPFAGSPQKVLAAHVMEVPATLSTHRTGISPQLDQAVMRCLEKRPADRWQSATELLSILESLATPSAGMQPTAARVTAVPAPQRRWPVAVAVGAVLLGAAGFIAYRASLGAPPTLVLGKATQLTTETGLQIHPAISPDGKFVAYAAGTATRMRIFIRPVAGGRVIPLSDDTTALEVGPRWSPDGTQLLFLNGGAVAIAPALGGTSRAVVPSSEQSLVETADWSPDGSEIAFVRSDSLIVQPLSGNAPRFIAKYENISDCHWSPAGSVIACVAGNSEAFRPGKTFGNSAPSAIVLFPTAGGAPQPLTEHDVQHQSPMWSHDGRSIFYISSRDGTRDVYQHAIGRDGQPSGTESRLTTGLNAQSLSLSADGQRIAYAVYSARANIWGMPMPAGAVASAESATQMTSGTQIVEMVTPSRDGKWLLFDADRNGLSDIYRMRASGGDAEALVHEKFDVFAPDLSPDGRMLAYHSWRNGNRDIEVKPLGGGPVEIVTNTPAQESYPRWSPDGQQIAFYDQAQKHVFITQRLAPGKWSRPVDRGPGLRPFWVHGGRELIASSRDTSAIIALSPTTGAARIIYAAIPGRADHPPPEAAIPIDDDARLLFKTHDAQGRASLWSVPFSGGNPRQLVKFPNLDHRSNRRDFGADSKHLYFTFEDQQSNIWIADVAKH